MTRKSFKFGWLAEAVLLCAAGPWPGIWAQSFEVFPRAIADSGGRLSSGGGWSVEGSLGQPWADPSAGGGFELAGGLWAATFSVSAGEAPELLISVAAGQVRLAWQGGDSQWRLEQTSQLAPPNDNWTAVAGTPLLENQTRLLTLPVERGARYFRLKHP